MSTGAIRQSAVYEVSQSLGDLPESLRMRSLEWGVLFSVTGRHTVAQIGELLGLPKDARDAAFGRLLDRGLLRERELTYSEYLRAAATSDDSEPKNLQEFLRSGAAWRRETSESTAVVAPASAPAEASASKTVEQNSLSLESEDDPDFDPTVTRAVPTMSREEIMAFRPLSSPSPRGRKEAKPDTEAPSTAGPDTPAPQVKTLSLRALMSYIMDRAPDLSSGQLDIYRVFIRVDTDLLKRNGITTLRFKEDRRVQDPELQSAISASLKSTLGLAFPDEAYV